MRVIFARHGESRANVEGVICNRDQPYGLTTLGRHQARVLGERLRSEGVGALYSSPIPRAYETAGIVGRCLGLTPVVAAGLREPDRGMLEGRRDAAAWRQHEALHRRWMVDHDHSARIEGGESLVEVRRRLEAFLDELVRQHGTSDSAVLCITHGALMLAVLPLVLHDAPLAEAGTSVVGHTATICALCRDGRWYQESPR